MGVAYAQDLRDRVLAAYNRGMKTRQIAELFEVSSSWARRVKQRQRETGETALRPRGGATVIKIDLDRLAGLVKQRPDATIKELHALLGVDCVESAVCMALKRHRACGLPIRDGRDADRRGYLKVFVAGARSEPTTSIYRGS